MPDPQPSRFSLSEELSESRTCSSCMGSGLTYRDLTALWRDVSVWVSLLILLILLATWLYVGSYRSEYGAQESRLVSGTRDHPVAVLHTPDAIYVLGGGTLADTDGASEKHGVWDAPLFDTVCPGLSESLLPGNIH